jgi:DNA-binding response OmpR family regulator
LTSQEARKILIVEDEVLVSMHLEDLLTEMGHHVIGPSNRVVEAVELASHAEIDFAVLDVNVAGTMSFPVAAILRRRGIPFVFASGYGSQGLIDGYRQEITLRKPYESDELRRAIDAAFTRVSR